MSEAVTGTQADKLTIFNPLADSKMAARTGGLPYVIDGARGKTYLDYKLHDLYEAAGQKVYEQVAMQGLMTPERLRITADFDSEHRRIHYNRQVTLSSQGELQLTFLGTENRMPLIDFLTQAADLDTTSYPEGHTFELRLNALYSAIALARDRRVERDSELNCSAIQASSVPYRPDKNPEPTLSARFDSANFPEKASIANEGIVHLDKVERRLRSEANLVADIFSLMQSGGALNE